MRLVIFVDEHDDQPSFLDRLESVVPRDAEVHLIHVVNPLTDTADRFALSNAEAVAAVMRDWDSRLGRLADASALPASHAVEQMQHGEDLADSLLRVASEAGADVIALGTRRAGTARAVLLGSVADAVLRKAKVPVLVVHID